MAYINFRYLFRKCLLVLLDSLSLLLLEPLPLALVELRDLRVLLGQPLLQEAVPLLSGGNEYLVHDEVIKKFLSELGRLDESISGILLQLGFYGVPLSVLV